MNTTQKLHAGAPFPTLALKGLHGDTHDIGHRSAPARWKLVVIYRGRHCPLCTKYLNALETHLSALAEIGVEVAAV